MKNFAILLVFIFLATVTNAQKKNGTIFSEHENIEKGKLLWSAFGKSEKEAYANFFADSIFEFTNGILKKRAKEDIAGDVEWSLDYDKLTIEDQPGATPDAIKYDNGDFRVADWIHLKGTHKETGINIDLPVHNLYSFNDEGKIFAIHQYFDNSIFKEINNSITTKENGIVYINHPYNCYGQKINQCFL